MTSWSDRAAAYEAARRLQRADGSWSNDSLRQIADLYQVGYSTLRRWLSVGFPEPTNERGWMPTHADYVAVATHLSMREAWSERSASGAVAVTYQTYCRRLKETDRGLIEAALHGNEALVRNRLYLIGKPMHRNHTWAFDHTELPVWVTIPRFKDPIKPWVTIVTDTYSRAMLTIVLIIGKPTVETVAAALTESAVGREYDGTYIGGLPVQVQYDNAKEHFGEAVSAGLARLGIVGVPIDNHASWQNGQAESKIGLLQKEGLKRVPGVTLGGRNRSGKPRFMPPNTGDLWSIGKLARHLSDFQYRWNVTRTQGPLHGEVPVAKWRSDDTELLQITEDALIANMMKEAATHKILTKGVFFRNSYYTPIDDNAHVGDDVHVRYLERNRDFISISKSRDFNVFTFAIHEDALTQANRLKLLKARARQEEEARRVDADATARRVHATAVGLKRPPEPHDAGHMGAEASGEVLLVDHMPEGSPLPDAPEPAVDDDFGAAVVGALPADSGIAAVAGDADRDSESDARARRLLDLAGDSSVATASSLSIMNTEATRKRPVNRRRAPMPAAPARDEHPARTEARTSRAADRVARRGLPVPGKQPSPEPDGK